MSCHQYGFRWTKYIVFRKIGNCRILSPIKDRILIKINAYTAVDFWLLIIICRRRSDDDDDDDSIEESDEEEDSSSFVEDDNDNDNDNDCDI